MIGFCEWLAQTPWSIALHESAWGYPLVESVHVLALCLFLGMTVMLDLRLLGVALRGAPVSEVVEQRWLVGRDRLPSSDVLDKDGKVRYGTRLEVAGHLKTPTRPSRSECGQIQARSR